MPSVNPARPPPIIVIGFSAATLLLSSRDEEMTEQADRPLGEFPMSVLRPEFRKFPFRKSSANTYGRIMAGDRTTANEP